MQPLRWRSFLFIGTLCMVLGICALKWPFRSTVGLTLGVGTLLVMNGIVLVLQTVQLSRERGAAGRALLALVSLLSGLAILRYPVAGMAGIAMGLTFYLFLSAGGKIAASIALYPHHGWGWELVSAVASSVLGLFLIANFPVTALWLPGAILGLDLIAHGATLLGLGVALWRARRAIEEAVEAPVEERKAA